MGLKLIAAATAATSAVTVGGYIAAKERATYRYDPAVEAVVLRHGVLVHRHETTNPAGFTQWQMTYLLVTMPGATSGDDGAVRLARDLRAEGWRMTEHAGDGFSGRPPDKPVAVSVEGLDAYLRDLRVDPGDELAALRDRTPDPGRVVLVTLEAQG